ncbi:unnamed protein product, partial [marine sediment metagenome]
ISPEGETEKQGGKKVKAASPAKQTKARAQATKPVSAPAAQETPPEEAIAGKGFHIDMTWLREALDKIKWNEGTAWSFVTSQYKVDGSGTFAQTLQRLTREQAENFVKEINSRVEKQTSLF